MIQEIQDKLFTTTKSTLWPIRVPKDLKVHPEVYYWGCAMLPLAIPTSCCDLPQLLTASLCVSVNSLVMVHDPTQSNMEEWRLEGIVSTTCKCGWPPNSSEKVPRLAYRSSPHSELTAVCPSLRMKYQNVYSLASKQPVHFLLLAFGNAGLESELNRSLNWQWCLQTLLQFTAAQGFKSL